MSKMFRISLPDGTVREMPEGSTPADVAGAIGPGLAKAALAAQGFAPMIATPASSNFFAQTGFDAMKTGMLLTNAMPASIAQSA